MKASFNKRKIIVLSAVLVSVLYCCTQGQNKKHISTVAIAAEETLITTGNTIATRFLLPAGYVRVHAKANSFAEYCQQLALKPKGSKVQYYNGAYKANEVDAAVLDISVGDKDLQQCADAVIRLRADYFYESNQFEKIEFKLTNGFSVPFSKWIQGYRVQVIGNECSWKATAAGSGKEVYQKYLDFVFSYAGTLSLAKALHEKPITAIEIGDVFIRGGSPGHAIIVVDMAINEQGDKIFLLAQSYMPAQDIHILKNFENETNSPWYSIPSGDKMQTPEWTFATNELKTWQPE